MADDFLKRRLLEVQRRHRLLDESRFLFRAALQDAIDAGASYRELGELLDVAHSNIHRIVKEPKRGFWVT